VSDGFSAPFRVRFDDAGPDGRVRTSALLRYAQDLAWQHSDALGFDRAWYAGRDMTWVVRAAELVVLGSMPSGTTLTGTTRVVGWRRVWSRRRTEFTDPAEGTTLAWVHIDWVLIDGRGVPLRIPQEFQTVFDLAGDAMDGRIELSRVELAEPSPDASAASFAVRPQELDPLDHVNNAVYADWLEEQVLSVGADAGRLAVRRLPRRVRLEYARAAEGGSTVVATTWLDPDGRGWSCRVDDPDGTALLRSRLEAVDP
jgi:acyl-CoA thioester hydrolase